MRKRERKREEMFEINFNYDIMNLSTVIIVRVNKRNVGIFQDLINMG